MSLTIQLDDETAAILRELAASQNRTQNEVVRDALSASAQLGRCRLPKGVGKYHSGQADGSATARQILRDAVKEGQWP
jgi:hypothetical protein